jgi:uncharacterized damage-inducible protein DinB
VAEAMQTTSPKQQFLDVFNREYATTSRVIRAYPNDKLEMKPHETSMSAKELAWFLVMGHGLMDKALTTGFDWSAPPSPRPAPPDTIAELVTALEREHNRVVSTINSLDDAKLNGTVKFFVAPKTLGDIPTIDFLWFILMDHIHHRGQFSVYLRMAGGKVPSIYGPSRDEPWM